MILNKVLVRFIRVKESWSALNKCLYLVNFARFLFFVGMMCDEPSEAANNLEVLGKSAWFSKISQYFVEPPFSAVTAQIILRYESSSSTHLKTDSFSSFFAKQIKSN